MTDDKEPARILIGVPITGVCIDCLREFKGELGVRFIETPEGPGVELLVCVDSHDESRREVHAIGRVKKEDIPTVVETFAASSGHVH